MSWHLRAIPLVDGHQAVDYWVDRTGRLVDKVVDDAEQLPGRYVIHDLVDAHAHPAVANTFVPGQSGRRANAGTAVRVIVE
jgi:hypothetical protein